MAWRCSAASNAELVANLHKNGLCKSDEVIKAMQATDRMFYAPNNPYEDSPQHIGFKATISAPHMHAWALEILAPVLQRAHANVLDVGCGSGYLTACFHRMVSPRGGRAVGIDYLPDLVKLARENLEHDDPHFVQAIPLHVGDGWKGSPQDGPFDAIHVGAAAASLPTALLEQLKPGGIMVIPIGPAGKNQELWRYEKDNQGKVSSRVITGVVYVPLVRTSSETSFTSSS
mmetsp:Transcript_2134/g.4904  ORF Transcript_2134/g.4904 Transcript_2134/m.4904 type:complete len:230 (-) Transcript_2134:172-861(-)